MFSAFAKAIFQLPEKSLRRVVWIGILGSIAVFAGLWFIITLGIASFGIVETSWFGFLLSGIAVLIATYFLFPSVATLIVGFFLEDVAHAVEAKHFPGLAERRKQNIGEILTIIIKFSVLAVILNILALPLYFVPPFNLFVFYALNGYLLGREYYELVAHRRIEPAEARRLRVAFRGQCFVAGVAIALLMTIPLVNLLAPVIGTAAMVHLIQGWRNKLAAEGSRER